MCNGGFSVRSARSSASSSSFLNCGSCSATQLFTNVATRTATEVSILTSSIASAGHQCVAKSSRVTLASGNVHVHVHLPPGKTSGRRPPQFGNAVCHWMNHI